MYFYLAKTGEEKVKKELNVYDKYGNLVSTSHRIESNNFHYLSIGGKPHILVNLPTYTKNGYFLVKDGKLVYVDKNGNEVGVNPQLGRSRKYQFIAFDFMPFSVGGQDYVLIANFMYGEKDGMKTIFGIGKVENGKISISKVKRVAENWIPIISYHINEDSGWAFLRINDDFMLGVSPTLENKTHIEITPIKQHKDYFGIPIFGKNSFFIEKGKYFSTVEQYSLKDGGLVRTYKNVLHQNEKYILSYEFDRLSGRYNLIVFDKESGNEVGRVEHPTFVPDDDEHNYHAFTTLDGNVIVTSHNTVRLFGFDGNVIAEINGFKSNYGYSITEVGKLRGGRKYLIHHYGNGLFVLDFDNGKVETVGDYAQLKKMDFEYISQVGLSIWDNSQLSLKVNNVMLNLVNSFGNNPNPLFTTKGIEPLKVVQVGKTENWITFQNEGANKVLTYIGDGFFHMFEKVGDTPNLRLHRLMKLKGKNIVNVLTELKIC